VMATNLQTGCMAQMSGSPQVLVHPLPMADAGADQYILQGSTVQLTGNVVPSSGNYHFQWSPQSLCISPQQATTNTHALFVSTAFTFSVVDNQYGCASQSDTCVVYITDGPLSLQIIQSASTICKGESVQLSAIAGGGSGNYSYSWTSSPPGFVSSLPNPLVTPDETTVYHLVLSDGITSVSGSVSVEVFNLPQIYSVNGGGGFCMGDEGVDIGLTGSQQGITYKLFHHDMEVATHQGDGQPFSFGMFNDPGSYEARAENGQGCWQEMNGQATVFIYDIPTADAGLNKLVNAGQSATLDGDASGGTPPYGFNWTPVDFLINPTNPLPATEPLYQTRLFQLQVTDAHQCASIPDNVVVVVTGGELTLSVLTSGYPVCGGELVTLYALVTGGTGNFEYFWQSNPVGFTSTLYNPTINPTQTTTYTVTVNDGLTVLSGSVTVEVFPQPSSYQVLGGGTVCQGYPFDDILLSGSETNTTYQLLRDGQATGVSKNGDGYALNFGMQQTEGVYTIFAHGDNSQCSALMNGTAILAVLPIPVVNAGPDQLIGSGTSTNLSGSVDGSGNYQYLWNPSSACLNPLSINTETIPLSQSTLFTFRATNESTQCVSENDTVIVYVEGGNQLLASASATPAVLCQGDVVHLSVLPSGGTGNYQYAWTSNPVGFYSSAMHVEAYPQVSTYYYTQVFDGVSYAYDTVYVEVLPPPVIFNVTGGGSYCAGEPGVMVGLSGSQVGYDYTLLNESGAAIVVFHGSGQPLNFGLIHEEGAYVVEAGNSGGCTQTMNGQANVHRNNLPLAHAGDDITIASGQQALLSGSGTSGSGSYSYNWSPADSLQNSTVPSTLTVPLHISNVFSLTVTDAQTGCVSQSDEVLVMVAGGPFTLRVLADASTICPGEQIHLHAIASGGNGYYTYQWSSQPTGFPSNLMSPLVSPVTTTTYQVTVSDGAHELTGSVTVEVSTLPTVFSVSGGGMVCQGDEPDAITLSGSQTGYQYQLLQDGVATQITRTGNGFPLHFGVLTADGQYTVQARNTHQCSIGMAGQAVVSIQPLPVANAGPDVIVQENTATVLSGSVTNGTGNAYAYQWQPVVLCQNPQAATTQTVPLSSSEMFQFTVTNIQNGCVSRPDTVFVFTVGSDLYAHAEASLLSICSGESVHLTAIAGGGTGNYSYFWSSSPVGTHSSQQSFEVQPIITTTYFLEVFDGQTTVFDTITIQVGSTPSVFSLSEGGAFCPNETGVEIGLTASETGVNYQLFLEPNQLVTTLVGTGQSLDFGYFTQQGIYTATAMGNNGCITAMNGQAQVIEHTTPMADAGADQYISWNQQALLSGNATSGSGHYHFLWHPEDSLVNPENREALSVPLHATTLFQLTVDDQNTGCTGEPDNMVVFVTGGALRVDVYANIDHICQGESIQLFALPTGGTGNYSYLWLSDPPGFSASIYIPVADPDVSSWFKVIVSDGVNTVVDSVFVNVTPSPTGFQLTGGGSFCDGQQGNNIVLTNSELETAYSLYRDQSGELLTLPGSGEPLDFGEQNQSGYYWVMAQQNFTNCLAPMNDTVQVQVIELPLADAGTDQFIQTGTSTQLFGTGSGGGGTYSFAWSPDYLLTNPLSQQPYTVPLDISSHFYLNVTDIQSGCLSQTDQTSVFVLGGPLAVSVGANPGSICAGQLVSLSAIPTGGSGNYSYLWTSEPAGFVSNIPNPVVYPEVDTRYMVRVEDGISVAFDTVTVTVFTRPELFVLTGGGSYCPGNQGPAIQLSGSQVGVVYMLYRNGLAVAQQQGNGSPVNFGHFTEPGLYSADASFTGSGCTIQMAGSATVVKNPLPLVDAGPDITIESGDYATLTGSATGGSGMYQFSWSPVEYLLNPNDPDATTIPLTATRLFTLEVEDAETGCEGNPSNVIVFVSGGLLQVQVIAATQSVCPGDQLTLYALPGGGSGEYTYFWESNPAGFHATGQEVVVTPLVATWYKVSVTDGTSTVADSIYIMPYAAPVAYPLLGGGTYCEGGDGAEIVLEQSTVSVSYQLMYQAIPTGVYQTGTGSAINFGSYFADGNYSVLATNSTGCIAQMANSVNISVSENPKPYSVVGGGTYCKNDPELGLLLESSEPNTSYELMVDALPLGIVKQGTGLPLSFGGLPQSGIYSVIATHNNTQCTSVMSGSAPYIILETPEVSISGVEVMCSADSVVLSGTGAYTYEWNTFPVQHAPEIKVSPEATTLYVLTGYLQNGCSGEAEHELVVNERPQISLINDPNALVVSALPAGLTQYVFSIHEQDVQSGSNNRWSYGGYSGTSDTLRVMGIAENGCFAQAALYLEMEEAPNAFTPNNDGKNDVFLPGVEIWVYSSWGGELYHGTEGWDGRYNGEVVVPGTYYYVRPVYHADGSLLKTIKGSVTVVVE